MLLTLTPIDTVLKTGCAEHSQLADDIIGILKREYHIHVSACYVQDGSHLLIPSDTSIKELVRSDRLEFVNEAVLTFYIHSKFTDPSLSEKTIKRTIHDVFHAALDRNGSSLSYERQYTPEEISYYGWNHTRKSEWDLQKIIPSKPAAENSDITNIEYIDRLALWNYMSDALQKANSRKIIKQIHAKVFVSFRQGVPVYCILLPRGQSSLPDAGLPDEFSACMTDILKPLDQWDVISPASMTPMITAWDDLTPEQRFAMLKN